MQLYLLFSRSWKLFSTLIAILLLAQPLNAWLRTPGYYVSAANSIKEDNGVDSISLDHLGFQAIQSLHLQLDDDRDGQVDISESDEFLREELEYTDGHERQKALHRNKKSVTVHELWESWRKSEVHNWTVQETVEWLETVVELPQYAKSFLDNQVDGLALPRLASNMSFISQVLGIKDAIHKRKLSIKAMDAVLFGPYKHHNYVKDALLVTFLIIAVGGCWFAYHQHHHSQTNMRKMLRDIEKLQKMEDSLGGLQKELDEARQQILEKENLERHHHDEKDLLGFGLGKEDMGEACTTIGLLQDELKRAREELQRRALEQSSWTPPPALQLWLQLTYELEMLHFTNRKKNVWSQLHAAKEACEKLGKNRYNFFKFIQAVHSNGASNDDVDGRIDQTKNSVKELEREMKDRSERWRHIEMLCGFSVVVNPGLAVLEKKLRNGGSHFGPLQFLHANQEDLDDRESLQRYTIGTGSASVPATYLTTPIGWPPDLVQRPAHPHSTATTPVVSAAIGPNGHIVGNSTDISVSPTETAGSVTPPEYLLQNSPRQGGNRPATLTIRGSSSDNNLATNLTLNAAAVTSSFVRHKSSVGTRAAFMIGESSPSLDLCLDTPLESANGASSTASSAAGVAASATTSLTVSRPNPVLVTSASVCDAQVKASDSSMAWRKTKSHSHDQASPPREKVLPGQLSDPSLNGTGAVNQGAANASSRLVAPLHKSISGEEDKSSDSSSTTTVTSIEKKKKKPFFGGRKLKLRH